MVPGGREIQICELQTSEKLETVRTEFSARVMLGTQ